VQDASSNIAAGAGGTSKNPHYFNTSTTPVSGTSNINGTAYVGATDGVGNQFGTVYPLGTIVNPTNVNYDGYTTVPLTAFSAAAEAMLVADLNGTSKFRIIVSPESTSTTPTQLADWVYGYANANSTYAVANGLPINYYIQPELSFNVSYTQSENALPAYITPSANAVYVYDSSTKSLTVTSGTVTIGADLSSDTTDPTPSQLKITSSGATASVVIDTPQVLVSSVTTVNGGTVTGLSTPAWLNPAAGAVYSWDATTQHLEIFSGTVTITSDPAAPTLGASPSTPDLPYVTVTGSTASLVVSSTSTTGTHLAGLSLSNGATAHIATLSTTQVVFIAAGNLALSIDGTSTLDVGKNIVDLQNGLTAATNTALLSQVNGEVVKGYNNGAWNGTGGSIDSSAAAADTTYLSAIGIALGSQFAGTTLDGQAPGAFDVLIRDTYYGDANVDGKVDGSDYSKIDSGFLAHSVGWANGDFNYDGVVDGSDYTLIDNAFNQQNSPFGTPTAEVATPTAQIAGPVAKSTKSVKTLVASVGNARSTAVNGSAVTGSAVNGSGATGSTFAPAGSTSIEELLKQDSSNVLLAKDVLDGLHAG
jgi:hypothetical protein